MITPEMARETAVAFVKENRPGTRVSGLAEDAEDYAVQLELVGDRVWPRGYAIILISKATGALREEAPGAVFEKLLAMEDVAS